VQSAIEGQDTDPRIVDPIQAGERIVEIGGNWREGPKTLYYHRALSGKVLSS
jgi:hypothetical protein